MWFYNSRCCVSSIRFDSFCVSRIDSVVTLLCLTAASSCYVLLCVRVDFSVSFCVALC